MLTASKRCKEYRRNVFWQRNDPQCIQDEVMSYRAIKLPEHNIQKKVEDVKREDRTEGKGEKSIHSDGLLMMTGIEVFDRVLDQKKIETEEYDSLSRELSNKEVRRQEEEEKEIKEKALQEELKIELQSKDAHITSLKKKLNGVYEQSLHHFDHMSLEFKSLLEEHNVKVVQCRAFKDEAGSLRSQIDLANYRCGKMEWLVTDEQKDHEETRQKHRQQLALNRKQSFQIEDLQEDIVGKEKVIGDLKDQLKEKQGELENQEALNANAVGNLQKELFKCKKDLENQNADSSEQERLSEVALDGLQKEMGAYKKELEMEIFKKLEREKMYEAVVRNLQKELCEQKDALENEKEKHRRERWTNAVTVVNFKKKLGECKRELGKSKMELEMEKEKISEREVASTDAMEILREELGACKKELKMEKVERLEQEKLNANASEGLQKELHKYKTELKVEIEKKSQYEKLNAAVVKSLEKKIGESKLELDGAREKFKILEDGILKKKVEDEASLGNLNNDELGVQKQANGELQIKAPRLQASLKEDIEKALVAKQKLIEKIDKLVRALSARDIENGRLARACDGFASKNKYLQASLDKVLSDLKSTRHTCTKEKMWRKELSGKIADMTNRKDGEFSKVQNKLEATKTYLVKIIRENEMMKGKLETLTPVGQECIMQSELKNKKQHKRRRKQEQKRKNKKNNVGDIGDIRGASIESLTSSNGDRSEHKIRVVQLSQKGKKKHTISLCILKRNFQH